MSAAELLSMLNTRSPDLKMLPPGFGALSTIDVAHALAKVDGEGARLIGRVLYAQQDARMFDLMKVLYNKLAAEAHYKRWKNTTPLWKAAGVAVDLYCYPERCIQCQGIGERRWGARVVVCSRCKGNTWEPLRDARFAKKLGVSAAAFNTTWSKRLRFAYDLLAEMDRDCIKGLSRALADNAP